MALTIVFGRFDFQAMICSQNDHTHVLVEETTRCTAMRRELNGREKKYTVQKKMKGRQGKEGKALWGDRKRC